MSAIKKSPNALETNELLDLLDKTTPVKDEPESIGLNYKNDTLNFLSVFNIQDGQDKIKKNTLYAIYRVWSKDPISPKDFHMEMKKFLAGTQLNNSVGYRINNNAIKLTHEAYSKFKQENNKLKSKFWTSHFEDFLLFNALKSGTFWIEAPILYFVYDKYAHERGLDRTGKTYMSREVFYAYADLFLKYKKTKDGKIYGLTESITNMFQDGQLERMRITHIKDEKKKKAEPKKSSRKPRSNTKV